MAISLNLVSGDCPARRGGLKSHRLPADDCPEVEAWLATSAARRELILVCSDAWLANN